MIALLRRIHELLCERLGSRAARIVATVLAVAAVAAVATPILGTASALAAQRGPILAALRGCSAAERDPVAVQLLERGVVRVGDRDYGGPLVVGRALDLFDDAGRIPAETADDLSWRLLADQVPAWMPYALVRSQALVAAAAAATAAAAVGVIWAGFLVPALEAALLVAAVAAACWRLGWLTAARWSVSAALCFLLFAFLWRLVRLGLSARGGASAVAGNTALEGTRTLALPGFALPVALLLPFLALSRERGEALYQAIPGFLDWGHTATYVFAAIFVLLFGCATAAFEVRDRQVWSVVTKPVSGGTWLLGKWLGTFALGMTIVVGGTALLGAGSAYMAAQRPIDARDARDVREAVLIGRVGTLPEYQQIPADELRAAIDAEIESDGVLRADLANGLRDEGEVRRGIAARKRKEFLDSQRRIGPGESREFVFRGLRGAVDSGRRIALRYRFHGGGDDEHMRFPAMIQYVSGKDAGSWELREWVPGEPYTLALDPKFVDPDGTLRIRIFSAGWDEAANRPAPGSVTMFMTDDSLEVMAEDSTFAGNLASAVAVDACKIAFLSALAVCAGALLSFPIAVLLAFGVFALATLTPFLATSLSNYDPDQKSGFVIWAFQNVVLGIATAVEYLLRGFAARSPSDSLAQGRSITWLALWQAASGIGVLWTGGVLALGWLCVRRKEMAVYGGNS